MNNLLKIWGITSLILAVVVGVQYSLPMIFKNNEYLDMLLNQEQNMIALLTTIVVSSILVLLSVSDKKEIQKYTNKFFETKSVKLLVYAVSIVVCVIFVLVEVGNITSSVVNAKNVDRLEGEVSKVEKTSLKSNGEVVKFITVKDSKGKQYQLVPSAKIETLDVNDREKVKIDYIPNDKDQTQYGKPIDGIIVGYAARS